MGTNVRTSEFNAGLLARSQFASGRSCDRPNSIKVFLGTRANAELVPKFHVALHASHAALPMATLKISPYTNNFDFWLWLRAVSPCSWGIWVREPYTDKKETVKQRHENWYGALHQDELADRPLVAYNLSLNLHHCTANYRQVLSSEREPNTNTNCLKWSKRERKKFVAGPRWGPEHKTD
jgi:hypothetical protein